MTIDISEQSKQDVREIARFIYKDNEDAAIRFLDAVEETYMMLDEFPGLGHSTVFDFVDGLQTLLIKGFSNYHVFYREVDDHIRIERVADGRRDLPKLFEYLRKDSSYN